MIHRLRLRNWRSYEDLDLRLDPGTTFVVAPNGVGKTSLVYGLAWGVFGKHSSVDPRRCIRAGAANAEVEVEVDLPDGRRLTISRTAKRRGAPKSEYHIRGERLTESLALNEMENAFGVELPVAGRLSMMLGGGHIAASDTLNLESHLHHAFGVSHLLSAAKTAESVAKEARKARTALRSTTKQRMGNRTALETEITGLEEEITNLIRRGTRLKRVRDAAAAQRALIERHLALLEQFNRYQEQRSRLVTSIEKLLHRPVSHDSNEVIGSELRTELEASECAILEIEESVVTARSVVAASEQAIRLLEGDQAICPTCVRPLPLHERTSAISAHRTQQKSAESEVRRFDEARRVRQTHSRTVSRLLAQLQALQPPDTPAEEASMPDIVAADALYQQASADLDEHNQHLGRIESRLESLRTQIASDEQVQEEDRRLRMAYRREAATLAGAKVLRAAADHAIESRINPMARELRGRWKHLFTNNGLVFRPDGSITRSRDGEELVWDTLSGGERTWARIITHLIVMGTTTSLPFAWFDEPLEHLDPQLRHAVAATLATATRGGSPRQLLVTTYEHGIAQQLADNADDAGVVALRESGPSISRPER